VHNPKNAGRFETLRRALFVSWVAGVGALATVGPTPSNAVGLSETVTRLTLYTLCAVLAIAWVLARTPTGRLPASRDRALWLRH
jgi:hypothetical protein